MSTQETNDGNQASEKSRLDCIDLFLRRLYLRSQRTHGGWLDRWFSAGAQEGTLAASRVQIYPAMNVFLFAAMILVVMMAPRDGAENLSQWILPLAICGFYLLLHLSLCWLPPKRFFRVDVLQLVFVGGVFVVSVYFPQTLAGTNVVVESVDAEEGVLSFLKAPFNFEQGGGTWHVLLPVIFALLVGVVFVAPHVAEWCLGDLRQQFRTGDQSLSKRLDKCDLFVTPKLFDPKSWSDVGRVLLGLPTVVLQKPVIVLYWPAVWYVFCFGPKVSIPMKIITGAIVLSLTAIIILAQSSPRIHEMADLLRRPLFHGGPAVVSYTIIALAIARGFNVGYVTTVLDGAPFVIIWWFLSVYLAFWIYEYGINSILNERILSFLVRDEDSKEKTATSIDCSCQEMVRAHTPLANDRSIQIHGTAGYVVIGKASDKVSTRWQFYNRLELFEAIVRETTVVQRCERTAEFKDETFEAAVKRGIEPSFPHAKNKCPVKPGRIFPDDSILLGKLRWAIACYFGVLNLLLILMLSIGFLSLHPLAEDTRVPVVKIEGAKLPTTETDDNSAVAIRRRGGKPLDVESTTKADRNRSRPDLGSRLFDRDPAEGPVVLLAASGGGTRAALYSASVLQGLHHEDLLDNVELLSGVSGGSVGLAYYAAHASSLTAEDKPTALRLDQLETDNAWKYFHDALAADYIVDVLRGLTEYRVLRGVTIGQHLAEGVNRQFQPDRRDVTLGELADGPLLIFNTTITGVYPPYSKGYQTDAAIPQERRRLASNADAYHSGARLIFTNFPVLGLPALTTPPTQAAQESELAFAEDGLTCFRQKAPWEYMKYVVVRNPEVKLAKAAALSANFPPVFQNAGVEFTLGNPADSADTAQSCQGAMYWVTDGGTTDNRGVISVLLALRGVIRAEAEFNKRTQKSEPDGEESTLAFYPDIHVLIADASRVDIDYKHDLGMQAGLISKVQLGNQLILELADDVGQEYEALQGERPKETLGQVRVHYLPMPAVLRMRGGVGTHWMAQEKAKVEDLFYLDRPAEEKNGNEPASLTDAEIRQIIYGLHLPPDDSRQTGDVPRVKKWIQEESDLKFISATVPRNVGHPAAWSRFTKECKTSENRVQKFKQYGVPKSAKYRKTGRRISGKPANWEVIGNADLISTDRACSNRRLFIRLIQTVSLSFGVLCSCWLESVYRFSE